MSKVRIRRKLEWLGFCVALIAGAMTIVGIGFDLSDRVPIKENEGVASAPDQESHPNFSITPPKISPAAPSPDTNPFMPEAPGASKEASEKSGDGPSSQGSYSKGSDQIDSALRPPSSAGWPVLVTIAVDEIRPDGQAWDQSTNTLDKDIAPDIIIQVKYDDETSDLLLGPPYQNDWLIHPWGKSARDLKDYPCMNKFACLISGELIHQPEFDVVVLEWDPDIKLFKTSAEEVITLHCLLDKPCKGGGIELLFRTI